RLRGRGAGHLRRLGRAVAATATVVTGADPVLVRAGGLARSCFAAAARVVDRRVAPSGRALLQLVPGCTGDRGPTDGVAARGVAGRRGQRGRGGRRTRHRRALARAVATATGGVAGPDAVLVGTRGLARDRLAAACRVVDGRVAASGGTLL